ncbi:MAG: peptidylprolyl isomerase [Aminivibrio sp.]|nr:peptidylprolyl isomerase [Aminivibrio sp.]
MKTFRTLSSALLVLLLLAFAAGAETAKTGDPAPEVKTPASEAKAPVDPETVLARVGETEIRMKDVREILGKLDPQRASMYDNEMGHRAILEEMVNMELFLLLGKELEVEKDPGFAEMLESVKKDIIRRFAVDRVMKDVKVTPEEIAEYYEKNKEQFTVPESVRASHILVSGDQEMQKVMEDLKAGMSFEDAAKKHSTCASKEQGGDLGYFSKGDMVKEFNDAVFAMKVGEVTAEPVKTKFGLHLIKLVEKKDASVRPLDEVKEELREALENDRKAKIYQGELSRLREKYTVEIVGEKKEEKKEETKETKEEKKEEKAGETGK